MKEAVFKFIKILIIIYISICGLLYFLQEKLIFFPEKLTNEYRFEFVQNFEEFDIRTHDNVVLNGILFKADSSKGLIFYLHGNAGSLRSWGQLADNYTKLHYDLFILDYRGFGKSGGSISSQKQLFNDIQIAYDSLRTRYKESRIIILGYSIGSGLAAKLGSANNPKMVILQAPYYSLKDLMKHNYRIVPAFLLKYKIETNKFIPECKMPLVIFHGDLDEVIYYGSSLKLKKLLKSGDVFITLKGQKHNGMNDNPGYLMYLRRILQEENIN
jgi:uncharacterized protein